MQKTAFWTLGFAIGLAAATGAVTASPGLQSSEGRSILDVPFHQHWFDSPAFGWNSASDHPQGGNRGVTTPLVPPSSAVPETKPPLAKTRVEVLDELFQRLAAAGDADEASGVALVIEHVWLQSGSDTADLLMGRAGTAAEKGDRDLAIRLLDKVVTLDPDWAEGWNKRATLRFMNDDDVGSMNDISRVLTLEPRHFGALTGMAAIMLGAGMKKDALAMLRKVASIYPHNANVEKQIEGLAPQVEGRGI